VIIESLLEHINDLSLGSAEQTCGGLRIHQLEKFARFPHGILSRRPRQRRVHECGGSDGRGAPPRYATHAEGAALRVQRHLFRRSFFVLYMKYFVSFGLW